MGDEFHMSSLSAAQVEKASFTPRSQEKKPIDMPESCSPDILSNLERRLQSQELRINFLESELKQVRALSSAAYSTDGSSTNGRSPVYPIGFQRDSTPCPQAKYLSLITSPSTRQLPPPLFYQTPRKFGEHNTQILRDHSGSSDQSGSPSPTLSLGPKPYLSEDLIAFESYLDSVTIKSQSETTPVDESGYDTLIEGLGLDSEIVDHRAEAKKHEKVM